MKKYKRILVAIDIYSEYAQILKRALCVAQKTTQLSVVFVTLPSTYFQPYICDVGGEFNTENAFSRLETHRRDSDLFPANLHIGTLA